MLLDLVLPVSSFLIPAGFFCILFSSLFYLHRSFPPAWVPSYFNTRLRKMCSDGVLNVLKLPSVGNAMWGHGNLRGLIATAHNRDIENIVVAAREIALCLPGVWIQTGRRFPAVWNLPVFARTPRSMIQQQLGRTGQLMEKLSMGLWPWVPSGLIKWVSCWFIMISLFRQPLSDGELWWTLYSHDDLHFPDGLAQKPRGVVISIFFLFWWSVWEARRVRDGKAEGVLAELQLDLKAPEPKLCVLFTVRPSPPWKNPGLSLMAGQEVPFSLFQDCTLDPKALGRQPP